MAEWNIISSIHGKEGFLRAVKWRMTTHFASLMNPLPDGLTDIWYTSSASRACDKI